MKVVLIGAGGTIGKQITQALQASGAEIIAVGRSSGAYRADISKRESLREAFKKIGSFDAVVNASGDVAFAPLGKLSPDQWALSISSKFMGQVQVAEEAIPYLRDGGSITLVSGILSEDPIRAGVAATTVNRAVEGFAVAAAIELPRGIRINVVSPGMLKESEGAYGAFFPGHIAVPGAHVGQAFKKSVMGGQTGQIYKVFS